MQVTRWIDKKKKNIDEAIEALTSHDGMDIEKKSGTWNNLRTQKAVEKNQEMAIGERNIVFNVVTYSYSVTLSDDSLPIEERTTKRSGKVIVYWEKENPIKYIINRNFDALTVLRFLLAYNSKNEIIDNQPKLNTDMFDWLIKKIYLKENDIELASGDSVLSIDNLVGFKGHPADEEKTVSVVSTAGTTVMNILSTLSFLLESAEIKQVEFNVSCGEHENIKLMLSEKVLGSDVNKYEGILDDDVNIDKLLKEAKIYLLCYLKLLPAIMQNYDFSKTVDKEDPESEKPSWSSEVHTKFLERVAKDLQEKIDTRVSQIK
ncbi:hypothetical protein [Levilactobacillus brevis]|uniref:hypothetical protein n=1 Tax=Levilactobacillus brevis TaxID=1580 RepID=UPI0021CA41DE|nr:hypothetical protein [Levilactobacillus brevis]MCU0199886.1 hypothetical protein [Levilactobacillus brevis]